MIEAYLQELEAEAEESNEQAEESSENSEELFSPPFHQNRTCRTKSYREEIGRQRNAWIRGRWKWKKR